MSYNPVPPRVWSRVQNSCTYINTNFPEQYNVYIPLTGENVSQAQADYETKMFYKGNILQYKGNSARLTKTQKYSQLARMAGPNRTKVFATQTETYTNPNTTSLLRRGYQTYLYPNQIPGAPNNISGPFSYNVPNPNDCSGNSIQDGGILVCGTYANPCNGEIYVNANTNATICNPAAASNVPGPSILCWNKKIQTFFPRQRYFMNNSTSKWPEGYKGLVSAISPLAPVLSIDSLSNTSVTLSWYDVSNNCVFISITNYLLYENNVLIDTLSSTQKSVTLNLKNCSIYSFYLVSYNSYSKATSPASNIVDVSVVPLPPTLSGTSTSLTQITLTWTPSVTCSPVTGWTIYDITLGTHTFVDASITTYIINNLTTGQTYSYYITANYYGGESIPSSTINVNFLYTILSGPSPTLVTYSSYTGLIFTYPTSLSPPSQSITSIVFNYSLTIGILMVGGGSSGGSGYGESAGAGGGGGGVVNTSSYSINVGTTYYITPGYGAIASSGSGSPPNQGGSSLFYTITSEPNYIYKATGGTDSAGSFDPGEGGNGYFNNQLIEYTNGGEGGLSYGGNQTNGEDCNISSVSLLGNTYYLGGGGGSGNNTNTAGGGCGNGTGGNYGASTSNVGQSAPPTSSTTSYGGGGGGGTYSGVSYSGGNGGNGLVILYWVS